MWSGDMSSNVYLAGKCSAGAGPGAFPGDGLIWNGAFKASGAV